MHHEQHSWPILGMTVLVHGASLAQRAQAGWGMALGVCSGSIAEDSHPCLQKGCVSGSRCYSWGCSSGAGEAVLARSEFSRWFLSSFSPLCHCFAESWCSPCLLLHGGRKELCPRVGIRDGGGFPSAVGRTNVIDLFWHLTKPQTLTPPKKPL